MCVDGGLELGLKAGRAELEAQWNGRRSGVVGTRVASALRRSCAAEFKGGWRGGDARRIAEGGTGAWRGAAEEWLAAALAKLGLAAEGVRQGRKVTAEKAELSQWLQERDDRVASVGERAAGMGPYSNAGRGPRKMKRADIRKLKQALGQLATIADGKK